MHSRNAKKMRADEIVETLVRSGFSQKQSVAILSVVVGIRTHRLSSDEAIEFLVDAGFEQETSKNLVTVFENALLAA